MTPAKRGKGGNSKQDLKSKKNAELPAAEKTKAPEEVAAPDVTHLAVAPVGERLVVESRKEEEKAEVSLDLSALTIDPPGTELGNGASAEVEELELNLSQYTLLDLGEETAVTRPKQAASPAPPDVRHLKLMPEPEPEKEDELT